MTRYTRFEVDLYDGVLNWWQVLLFVPLLLWTIAHGIADEIRNRD